MAGEARALTDVSASLSASHHQHHLYRASFRFAQRTRRFYPPVRTKRTLPRWATKCKKDEICAYVESQAHEEIVYLEKAASELVGPVYHDIWDVPCPESRWCTRRGLPNKPLRGSRHLRRCVLISVNASPGRPTGSPTLRAV